MKRVLRLVVTWLGASLLLLAAGFWENKEFTEWSDKEVARMMENSPWSREVSVPVMGRPGFGRGGAGGGVEGGGGGGGRRGRGGGSGPGELELARPMLSLHVRWMSALPVKQALVRSSMNSEQEMDERSQQFLNRVETHYVVTVSGIPSRMVGPESIERFAENCRIERGKNSEPLTAEKVEPRPEGNRVTLFFFFPRRSPITLADKNVEFILKAENLDVKRKFKLQDMVYRGKLEL